MTKECLRACVLGLAMVLSGCRDGGVQDCLDLAAAEKPEEAAVACERVFAEGGDPRTGAAVARAHYALGDQEAVLAWVERLEKAGKAEAGVASLAAGIHWQRGEKELADRALRRDLAAYESAGDAGGMADCLYGLFYFAWETSRYREALGFATRSFDKAVEAGDAVRQAKATEGLYTLLRDLGDLAGARRALDAAAGLGGRGAPLERARFLINGGLLRLDEGRPALARHDLELAVALAAGDDRLLRYAHLDLVQVNLDLGDVDRAERHLAAARKHADPQGPQASLLYFQARVELARGRFAAAAKTLDTALVEAPPSELAWELEYQKGRAAEAQGDLYAAEAAYERAAAVVEEMRRSLALDDFKAWLLDKKRAPLESLFRLQAHAGRTLDALATAERAQARTLLDAFVSAASTADAADRLETLQELIPAMSASSVATVRPIRESLEEFGDRHGLVYFEAGDEVWLITVAARQARLRRLAATAGEVRDLGDRFLARPADAATAEKLGRILLPAGALPERGEILYVVADGALGNLPFAALRHDGSYLVERHALVVTPSLSALAALEDHHGRYAGPTVLADPRGDLPGAALEGAEVGKLLGVSPLTLRQATSRALAGASSAGVLHLATHTGLGPRGPWLRLADRDVHAGEIVAGRIGPRLTVLASCASGVRPGRQMWGSVGTAFLAAGSRAVLSSLWSVEDRLARGFLHGFYAQGGAADPVEGLARAQRVAIGRGRSPMEWAPYVVLGSGLPLNDAF